MVQKFYGSFEQALAGFLIQFTLIFIIFTTIFTLFKRKHKQVLDLTEDITKKIQK